MKQFKMTKWQRGILLGMYMVACRQLDPMSVWFTRRSLEFLMWFDWTTTHTKKMEQLIEYRWVEKSVNTSGVIVYRLAAPGHGQISVDYAMAVANTHVVQNGDTLF